jgi:hypothetical protein
MGNNCFVTFNGFTMGFVPARSRIVPTKLFANVQAQE